MDRKPRIFINLHYMEIGGAERALLGLLNAIDTTRVDVDLFLNDQRGELMTYIPSKIHLLPAIPAYTMLERPIVELIRRGYWRIAIARIWARLVSHISTRKNVKHLDDASCFFYMSRYTTPLLPTINSEIEYDLAISFLSPHHIVLDKVRAKKKVAWVHTDYTNIYVDSEKELSMWAKFDKIAAISEEAASKFIQVFPSLVSKVFVCENILSSSLIQSCADEFIPDDIHNCENEIKLLSIGRYSSPKRFDKVPLICQQLINLIPESNIQWYIIGYGADEELIRHNIQAAGMQEHVILLGKRSNPYPYIKACNLYIQPSRYEGKSVSVREAQILCKPVAITNYPTAPSQIQNGIDGVIVPMNIHSCATGIARFIRNKQLREQITTYLREHDYGLTNEIEKIYNLL